MNATYPYHAYTSPVLRNKEQMKNSRTLPGDIVHFRNFRHTGPPGGAFILGRQKGKAYYHAASAGFEHGAFKPKLLMFAPVPIALHTAKVAVNC